MLSLIVLCGPPCSGKSSILRSLQGESELQRHSFLDLDAVSCPDSIEPEAHCLEDDAYAKLHDLTAAAIQRGAVGAVIAAEYYSQRQRRLLLSLAAGLSARLLVFECAVDPDVAVARHSLRIGGGPAYGLSPEEVWDLAQDFTGHSSATRLDSTTSNVEELAKIVLLRSRAPVATQATYVWEALGAPRPMTGPTATLPREDSVKLTPHSRCQARRNLFWRWLTFGASGCAAAFACGVLVKAMLDEVLPGVRSRGFEGDPADWIQTWVAMASLAAGIGLLREYLLDGRRARALRAVLGAGGTPRFDLEELPTSNRDVYRRYVRRLSSSQQTRMPIPDVPLWFLVPPSSEGFEVDVLPVACSPIDQRLLERRAAELGLDWTSYTHWRIRQVEERYFGRYREKSIRLLDLHEAKHGIRLSACPGDYRNYVCHELSCNLRMRGRSGYELRQLLEGPAWVRSRRIGSDATLDLGDVPNAARTFEMLVGVQVGLTTSDGYLVLQRRSNHVLLTPGGLSSSGAGNAKWKDIEQNGHSLLRSALREIEEEIGWVPHPEDRLERTFLGAAFSLFRGRDLNFFCYIDTKWTLAQIVGSREPWYRVGPKLRRLHRQSPRGFARAVDAWEVAHLVPIPVGAVDVNGRLKSPYDALLGESRQVRGLLYCLSRCTVFQEVQLRNPSASD